MEDNYLFLDIMDEKIFTRKKIHFLKIKNINKNKSNMKPKYKVIIIIALISVYLIMKAIDPIMEQQCKNMAKSVATKISNNESGKVIANYNYYDIMIITKDEKGNTKMIGTNLITLNKIISDISVNIQKELDNIKNNKFNIRLGSFLGNSFLSGVGPNIKIQMELIGNIDTKLKSKFISRGINQTLHKIYVEVKCNVIILTPYKTIKEQITNEILLAEEIIVGEVPDSYYNFDGINKQNAIDIIN